MWLREEENLTSSYIIIRIFSPAVNDIWTISRPLKVGQTSYEGNDGVRMIGDAKVWPPGVVELLHLSSVVPSAHPERPYGVVGQLLYLNQGHRKVTKVQAANLRPVLMALSLQSVQCIRESQAMTREGN